MIKEKEIIINGHPFNYKYYKDLGYDVCVRKPFLVKTQHLMKGSVVKITCVCDNCSKETKNVFKDYWNYTDGLNNPYYCNSCKVIKSELTSLDRWGFKNPMQSDEVKEKLRTSLLDKYGVDWYSKTDEWFSKFKKTSSDKWGFDNPAKSPEVRDCIRAKNTYLSDPLFKKNTKDKKERITYKKYIELLPNGYKSNSYNNGLFRISHSCGYDFDITKALLYNRLRYNSIICLKCNPIDIKSSSFETEIFNFIKSLGVKVERNNRDILNGKEIDLFIPDYNIGIECNGLYWHSELFKPKNYHLDKTLLCSNNGISLLHIWEDDWCYKRDIIKSIIKHRLKLNELIIFARRCEIRIITDNSYKEFLKKNHIQGYASSSYNIGLYYNNELVSLMTFSWRRTNNKREYELVRFCNKLDSVVIGSASRLFRFFAKNNIDIDRVVSYADISLFSGDLYKSLGFEMVSLSEPNYYWVVDGVRKHRYNYSKRKLVKKGYNIDKTEVQIMSDIGYYRVFSTGQIRYVYNQLH